MSIADGSFVTVINLVVCNMVKAQVPNGNIIWYKIKFIVKSKVTDYITMCEINNFLITPWHPIIYSGQWAFPINISQETNVQLGVIKWYSYFH